MKVILKCLWPRRCLRRIPSPCWKCAHIPNRGLERRRLRWGCLGTKSCQYATVCCYVGKWSGIVYTLFVALSVSETSPQRSFVKEMQLSCIQKNLKSFGSLLKPFLSSLSSSYYHEYQDSSALRQSSIGWNVFPHFSHWFFFSWLRYPEMLCYY